MRGLGRQEMGTRSWQRSARPAGDSTSRRSESCARAVHTSTGESPWRASTRAWPNSAVLSCLLPRDNILDVKHAIGQPERIFSMSSMLLVNQREYSQCQACYWSTRENVLNVKHAIGQPERIVSMSSMLLVNQREYSQCQACYRSTRENVLNVKHAIGQPERMFSMSSMLLVNQGEYSQCQACYWSTRENVLNVKHAIGQPERMFSMSSMLLVNQRECSQCQACYWSTGRRTRTDSFISLMPTHVTAKTIACSLTLVRGGGVVQSQNVPSRWPIGGQALET
jgi:hypothetical protein